ncbi:MAG: hypothetical protein ACLFOC_05745 [Campylobacterales bacterium]
MTTTDVDKIIQRSKQRDVSIDIKPLDSASDNSTKNLSPNEAIELVAKLSKESYFIQTGIKPSDRVDKSIFSIKQRK